MRVFVVLADDEINETFIVEHMAGDASGEKIRVIFGGREQIFEGVTKIIADAGDGNDQIFIRDGVEVPVELVGGSGSDIS